MILTILELILLLFGCDSGMHASYGFGVVTIEGGNKAYILSRKNRLSLSAQQALITAQLVEYKRQSAFCAWAVSVGGSIALLACAYRAYKAPLLQSPAYVCSVLAATLIFAGMDFYTDYTTKREGRRMNLTWLFCKECPVPADLINLKAPNKEEVWLQQLPEAYAECSVAELCLSKPIEAIACDTATVRLRGSVSLHSVPFTVAGQPVPWELQFPWIGHYTDQSKLIVNSHYVKPYTSAVASLVHQCTSWLLNPLSLTFLVGIARL